MTTMRMPAKPIHPAIDLLFIDYLPHDGRSGSAVASIVVQ